MIDDVPSHRLSTFERRLIAALVIGALAIRIFFWPGAIYRDTDETLYALSGVMLAEGLTPTFKAAPASPIIWESWLYVMADAARQLVHPNPADRTSEKLLRPYMALNAAIFDVYHDQTQLRHFELAMSVLAGCILTLVTARLGARFAGGAGALLLGSVAAFSPLFVQLSIHTRPYIYGWAFGVIAMSIGQSSRTAKSASTAFVILGLAISSRIEMLLLAPIMLWQFRTLFCDRPALLFRAIIASSITTLLLAPWLLTSLITNLKSVIAVKVIRTGLALPSWSQTLRELTLDAGLTLPLVLFVMALAAAFNTGRKSTATLAVIIALLLVVAFHGTGYGLHHEGALLVSSFYCGAIGLRWLDRYNPRLNWILASLSCLVAIGATSYSARQIKPPGTAGGIAEWVEANVQPGAPMYWKISIARQVLPTPKSADALWGKCVEEGWRKKYALIDKTVRLDAATDLPRALSLDNMTKEFTIFRSLFILGSRGNLPDPRFDFRDFGSGNVGDEELLYSRFKQSGGAIVLSLGEFPLAVERLGSPSKLFNPPNEGQSAVWVSTDAWKAATPSSAISRPAD